jgi:CheY-like chemotaxis protein
VDKGAEFIIHLPISTPGRSVELADERRVDPSAGGIAAGPMPSLAGLRILVVDDEADAREIVSAILGGAGAEVATAASVSQAIDLLDRWEPDVLVADIGMPGEDGYDLISKMRARFSAKRGQIPAIALTALARTQDRLKVLSAGYQMHVPKPVEPIELATVIASLTNRLWRL